MILYAAAAFLLHYRHCITILCFFYITKIHAAAFSLVFIHSCIKPLFFSFTQGCMFSLEHTQQRTSRSATLFHITFPLVFICCNKPRFSPPRVQISFTLQSLCFSLAAASPLHFIPVCNAIPLKWSQRFYILYARIIK